MSLHVERTGDGPDLVLLHGWAMHSGAWDEVIPSLARRYRVHAVDLPGHGRSPWREESFDQAAAGVARAVPDGATVCGWSLGGLLAQALATGWPSKVRGLVLVASTPCFVQRPDWTAAMSPANLDQFAQGLRHDRPATLERFVRLNALNGSESRSAIRALTARLQDRGAPSTAALEGTLAWLRDIDVRPLAPGIAAPTLLVHGARDAIAPIAAARWLAGRIPQAKLLELPDAAHLPFFTHRDRFVDALESFVG